MQPLGLILLGLPGSQHEAAASELGVPFAAEVFADRAYRGRWFTGRSLP